MQTFLNIMFNSIEAMSDIVVTILRNEATLRCVE